MSYENDNRSKLFLNFRIKYCHRHLRINHLFILLLVTNITTSRFFFVFVFLRMSITVPALIVRLLSSKPRWRIQCVRWSVQPLKLLGHSQLSTANVVGLHCSPPTMTMSYFVSQYVSNLYICAVDYNNSFAYYRSNYLFIVDITRAFTAVYNSI